MWSLPPPADPGFERLLRGWYLSHSFPNCLFKVQPSVEPSGLEVDAETDLGGEADSFPGHETGWVIEERVGATQRSLSTLAKMRASAVVAASLAMGGERPT